MVVGKGQYTQIFPLSFSIHNINYLANGYRIYPTGDVWNRLMFEPANTHRKFFMADFYSSADLRRWNNRFTT